MFYQARWPAPALLGYDPVTGRFAQADSIVPGGVQGLDRYAYVNNNPLRFTDPSGHYRVEESTSRRGCRHPLCSPNVEDKPDKPWHLRRTIFLGSHYIEVPYPSVEDEYEEFHLLNKGEWIAPFLDMLAKGLSYLKPNSEPAANLLIYLSYDISNSGLDNFSVELYNQSAKLVSLASLSVEPKIPNSSVAQYNIVPAGFSPALVQVRPKDSEKYLMCSNCISADSVNVPFLPSRSSLDVRVNVYWVGQNIPLSFAGTLSH